MRHKHKQSLHDYWTAQKTIEIYRSECKPRHWRAVLGSAGVLRNKLQIYRDLCTRVVETTKLHLVLNYATRTSNDIRDALTRLFEIYVWRRPNAVT